MTRRCAEGSFGWAQGQAPDVGLDLEGLGQLHACWLGVDTTVLTGSANLFQVMKTAREVESARSERALRARTGWR